MHAPVGSLGRNHIQMTVDEQSAALPVGPGQPREEVSTAGRARLDVLTGVADLFQLLLDPPRAFSLALGGLQLSGV
ncbi:Uncharacterised protein [Mycobacteroides abscessus subsp. massiliense]|nr:Uncharacterised protein [Mycobacteroides abscessus subsp. massiliense]